MPRPDRAARIANALWGLFIGDALAMPAHWFYNRENLRAAFDGGVTGYEDARHPHPEAFMLGMTYQPDLEGAARLSRPYDILHENARFYRTNYATFEFDLSAREGEHGNATAAAPERYHYHHGLKAGEMTVNAQLVRVLMRSVVEAGRYDPVAFLETMVAHMTTPGRNHDPYTEVFLRRWFERWTAGAPITQAAVTQREVWSVGSHGGMPRPMLVAMMGADAYEGIGHALEHQVLTHRSETLAGSLAMLIPVLHALLEGAEPLATLRALAARVRLPAIRGADLFARYREAQGPNNIPDREMYEIHTRLEEAPMDLDALHAMGDEAVVRTLISTACYTEHGLPMMLFHATLHGCDMEATLLANANAGGDNVNRALPLGLLLGAAGAEAPTHLKEGLAGSAELSREIGEFAEMAARGGLF
ncbi:MAG: ADP-ribosylglycohydrolase family protein [Pseudomonadota bacterium]